MTPQVGKAFVNVYRSPLPGVYVTAARSGQRFGRHWHDVYGFGVILDGAQKWYSGRGTVRGYAGDVICTNPGEVHDGEPLGGDTRHWVIVSVDAETMSSVTGWVPGEIGHPVISDPELAAVLRRLIQQFGGESSLRLEELVATACTLLMSRHGSRRVEVDVAPASVRRARERLGDDLTNPPSLAELAALTGLSRYQILRRFRRAYGLAPHAWLRNARVERARQLIQHGLPLIAAANASGFADQSHMTRVFRSHFGCTPSTFCNHVQDGIAAC